MSREDYLNGFKLCEKLGVRMYERIAIMLNRSGQVFGDAENHGAYFITPLGVAVRCNDGVGIFEVMRSRELWNGESRIFKQFGVFIGPKETRYTKQWVDDMMLRAGLHVRTKDAGTVGIAQVPAVRFKKRQKYVVK